MQVVDLSCPAVAMTCLNQGGKDRSWWCDDLAQFVRVTWLHCSNQFWNLNPCMCGKNVLENELSLPLQTSRDVSWTAFLLDLVVIVQPHCEKGCQVVEVSDTKICHFRPNHPPRNTCQVFEAHGPRPALSPTSWGEVAWIGSTSAPASWRWHHGWKPIAMGGLGAGSGCLIATKLKWICNMMWLTMGNMTICGT